MKTFYFITLQKMDDIVVNKSIELFQKLDSVIDQLQLTENQAIDFKYIYMNTVADMVIHFRLVPNVQWEWFELWKRTMWLHDYCVWGIMEIDNNESWEVNWYMAEHNIDISEQLKTIYNEFLWVC